MRSLAKRLWSEESGAIAPVFALALPALIVVGGLAFDYSRLVSLDTELQNAADQSALAAASQLDGEPGACERASAAVAAAGLVTNDTLFANDGNASGLSITVPSEPACDAIGRIRFYQDKAKATAATDDGNANFVEVIVNTRTAQYALTPVVGAFTSGAIDAAAMAGVGSAICRVPPLMICNPDPSQPFNADGKKGWGVQVTAKGNGAWGAGDFGFLQVGAGHKADLEKALAFGITTYDCAPATGTFPQSGNAQGLYNAINTRFDMYDTSGTPLGNCQSSDCPPASNVLKDIVKADASTTGNACKTHISQGWRLPPADRRFWPKDRALTTAGVTLMEEVNDTANSPSIDAMGLPHDLCHYDSYAAACKTLTGLTNDTYNRFGNGLWARGDYFNKYHSGRTPVNAGTMTRYETYLWELANGHAASISGTSAGSATQYSVPICSALSSGGIDRRVLTVAVVSNCALLSGVSTKVVVDEWVEMFLVEPVFDGRGNGALADSIYMEVIGESTIGGSGGATGPQTIRKDVPYLIE
jgi:Flp pilus assembly protein TadG